MDYRIEDLNANNVTSEGLFNIDVMLDSQRFDIDSSERGYFKKEFNLILTDHALNFCHDFTDAEVKNGLESLKFISQLGGEFADISIEYRKPVNSNYGFYYLCHNDEHGFTTTRWTEEAFSTFGYELDNYMEHCMLDFPEFSKRTGFMYLSEEDKAEIDAELEACKYED